MGGSINSLRVVDKKNFTLRVVDRKDACLHEANASFRRRQAKPQNVYPKDASHYYLFSLRAVGFVPLPVRRTPVCRNARKRAMAGGCLRGEKNLIFVRRTPLEELP